MKTIRVVLVDDHPVVRRDLRGLLEKAEDIVIVGEAATGREALKLTYDLHPDILILDMELPDIKGTEVAERLQESRSPVKVLALSAYDDSIYIRELLETGAAGYLMKDEAQETILDAIHGIANGEQGWVSRRIAAQMAVWMRNESGSGDSLTGRELEILRLVVEGRTNQYIAHTLGISEKTVEKYLGEIFGKLSVASRVEAAVYAVRNGLV